MIGKTAPKPRTDSPRANVWERGCCFQQVHLPIWSGPRFYPWPGCGPSSCQHVCVFSGFISTACVLIQSSFFHTDSDQFYLQRLSLVKVCIWEIQTGNVLKTPQHMAERAFILSVKETLGKSSWIEKQLVPCVQLRAFQLKGRVSSCEGYQLPLLRSCGVETRTENSVASWLPGPQSQGPRTGDRCTWSNQSVQNANSLGKTCSVFHMLLWLFSL